MGQTDFTEVEEEKQRWHLSETEKKENEWES